MINIEELAVAVVRKTWPLYSSRKTTVWMLIKSDEKPLTFGA